MESLHIEGTDEQLLSDRLESDINEGDGSLPVSLTARDLATQISNAWKEAVCRESCLFPTSCHTMLPQSELVMIPFLSSGLSSSCPYAFHTMFFNVFQTFVDFTAKRNSL